MRNAVILILFILAFMFGGRHANASYSGELAPGVYARLTDEQCSNPKLLQMISPEFHSVSKAGTVSFSPEKVVINVCWAEINGRIYGVDETGAGGEFDSSRLKKDLEV